MASSPPLDGTPSKAQSIETVAQDSPVSSGTELVQLRCPDHCERFRSGRLSLLHEDFHPLGAEVQRAWEQGLNKITFGSRSFKASC